MSKQIDDSRPFTDEEREWLKTIPSGPARITVNDRRFGHLSEAKKKALRKEAEADKAEDQRVQRQQQREQEDEFHPDDLDQVMPLETGQIRDRLKNLGLEPQGKTLDELRYQLLEHLDNQRRGVAETPDDVEE